jgi:3-deoxy-D-manno-octulosonic acid kinase
MMTKDGGQRIATTSGALLIDRDSLESAAEAALERLFEPSFWRARGELADVNGGRGAAWFIVSPPRQWALRHYRRGGLIARVSADRFVWCGERRVRAFAEWRLLAVLERLGLPVPKPVAARYQRSGLTYRCDLITRRISDARPLSSALSLAPLEEGAWRGVGAAVKRLHAAGADHADLNAHNILLSAAGAVSVIDFDRGRLRAPGAWAARNLARLHRSLAKIARRLPPDRFTDTAWNWLLAGYAAQLEPSS